MNVTNKTQNTILASDATFITSIKDRAIGLISSKKPKTIIFETRYGIHTFGMQYAIDVIVINPERKVVALKEHLKPNRFFLWRENARIVIELPEGSIKKTKTHLQDSIELK